MFVLFTYLPIYLSIIYLLSALKLHQQEERNNDLMLATEHFSVQSSKITSASNYKHEKRVDDDSDMG